MKAKKEKMENGDHVRDAKKGMPRGFAYMRFRNKGLTVEIEVPRRDDPLIEEVMTQAIKAVREAAEKGEF